MKDLFDQERPLSPSLIRLGVSVLGICLGVIAITIALFALGNLFSGRILTAIFQLAAGLALTLFIYLVVRLLSEVLFAFHRMNDRLGILSEDLRADRRAETAASTSKTASPARRAPAKRVSKKSSASTSGKTTPKPATKPKQKPED